MYKKFTKIVGCITALICLLLSGFSGMAQQTRTVESGDYYTALAKDNLGNIYATKYNSVSDKYDLVRYTNGITPPSIIYSGLAYDGVDYAWGIAVDSHGNVFIAAANPDNKVIKLTYNSGSDTYTASNVMAGNYYSALAVDGSDNLYTAEYNAGTGKYQIVRYAAGTYTGGTVLYDNIYLGSGYTYPTSIVVAANNDLYFNLPFGNSASPDQGGVLKLTAASGYTAVSTISSGKYSSSVALDPLGNLYVSEYKSATDQFVLNKYTNATGTPAQLATLDYDGGFYPWGIAVFNSDNIYFNTGSSPSHLGGAIMQLYASPVNQATNIVPSAESATTTTLNWTNGSGVKRAVFVTAGSSGSPTISNNTTYTASSNFGSGSQDATGAWYCVYNGTGSSVVLANLQANQSYRVKVMDYNGNPGQEQYQTADAVGNPLNLGVATINSIVRADPDNTFASTLNYTVTFGSTVTGLSTSNFSLAVGPYITGAAVSSVTAVSGSVYTVTVTKTAGSGDLTLSLASAAGVAPVLVSTLPFAGETYHLNTTEVDLSNIVPAEGTLSPAFSANTTAYSLLVHDATFLVTPTALNPTSTIQVNGQPVVSGNTSSPIALNVGNNTVTITVTSGSSPLTKSYTLSVDYELPLPVTWVDFEAQYQQHQYVWSWQLGVESQIAYYVAEYSLDGITYVAAGKVTQKNASLKYSFSKSLNLQGLVYFRVKAVNSDGSSVYSTIKTLQTNAVDASLVVYPSPVSAELHLKWPGANATSLDISIYNTVGKKVLQQKVSNGAVVTLQVGTLASGSYYLVVEDNEHLRITSGLFIKK